MPLRDAALTTEITRRIQACQSCADRIGIIPMPPPRRPRSPCARCNGWQFMRVIPREHTSARVGEMNAQVSAPMYVTHAPAAHRGWMMKHVKELEIEKSGLGLLETYICRTCGAVEWASKGRKFKTRFDKGKPVARGSMAYDCARSGDIADRARSVPAKLWIDTNEDVEIIEHSAPVSQVGGVITLLWVPEIIAARLWPSPA